MDTCVKCGKDAEKGGFSAIVESKAISPLCADCYFQVSGERVDWRQGTQIFVPLAQLGRWTKFFLFVIVGISCVALVSGLLQAGLLARAARGATIFESEAVSNDTRQQIIAWIQLLVYLGCAIIFLAWFYRAYKNLPSLGARDLKYSPGWAVGGFFIPFLNLVRPLQVMRETWHGSDPVDSPKQAAQDSKLSTPVLVAWWWWLFLASGFLGQASLRTAFQSSASLADLRTTTWLQLANNAVEIPGALVAAKLVSVVTNWQRERWRARSSHGRAGARDAESIPSETVSEVFTYMCPSCHLFQRSDVAACLKCDADNPHRTNIGHAT